MRPDTDLVGRWVAQRVLDLGWSPDHFAAIDAALREARDYVRAESERFAKKYTWIAYHHVLHELGACHIQEPHSSSAPFTDPWQLSGTRDIDPCIIARGDEPPSEAIASARRPCTTWWNYAFQPRLSERGDDVSWLDDRSDIPHHTSLLQATDPFGERWVALEAHVLWETSEHTPLAGSKRQQWMRSHAYLARSTDVRRIGDWAAQQDWMGLWMPTPAPFTLGLLGEYPDLGPWPSHLEEIRTSHYGVRSTAPADPYWSTLDTHGLTCDLALTTTSYSHQATHDHSVKTLKGGLMPSPALLGLLAARWAPTARHLHTAYQLGPVESDHSWQSGDELVAFASGLSDNESAAPLTLWVKASHLQECLARYELALWGWTLGEKVYWAEPHRPSRQRTTVSGAYHLTSGSLTPWATTIRRT